MNGKRKRISNVEKVSVAFAEMPIIHEEKRVAKGDFLLNKIKDSMSKISIMDSMTEKIERYSVGIIELPNGNKVCRILR